MRTAIFIVILVNIFHCVSYSQTFPVTAIIENEQKDNRINMVFLGDGYKITEMDKYHNDVQTIVNSIFIESPYKEYKKLFNVYAIDVASNESGTDHPGTATDCGTYHDSVFYRDTYFNTTFDAGNIHRSLILQGVDKLHQVLMNNFPEYDIVFMVVNTDWSGGTGSWMAVFSATYFSAEIAIHEAGHSFAHLDDEYDYGIPNPIKIEGFNVTCKTDRDSIRWKKWIFPTTPIPTPSTSIYSSVIGLFEGAYYSSKDIYRPKLTCKMKTLAVPFCEVCVEQHVKTMFNYINIIEEHYPNTDTVIIFTNNIYHFNINLIQLSLSENKIDWVLDNNVIAKDTDSISLDGLGLSIGTHIIFAKVKHTTPMVLNDPKNLLESSVKWFINVLNPTEVKEKDIIPTEYILKQNYPNPFNPVTTIKYAIPQQSFVNICIYNLLGEKILTLINEEKHPGNFEVLFDGSNLSSGVYFYKIVSGNFIGTKKLILMK